MSTPQTNVDSVQLALEAVNRIVRLTLQPLEPQGFLEQFVVEVAAALGAGSCTVWSLSGQELQLSAEHHVDPTAQPDLALPEQTQVQTISNVFQNRKPVVYTGIEDGKQIQASDRTVQAIFVPLLLKDQAYGVMRVLTRGVWDPTMLKNLASRAIALGSYLNLYVDNRTLRLEASEEVGFARLAKVSAALHAETDRERLYLTVANGLRDVITVDRGALGLVTGGTVRVAAVSGVDKIQPKAALIQKINAVMGDTADSGEGFCTNQGVAGTESVEGERGERLREYLEESKMMSLVAIPLKVADRTVGVLIFEKGSENGFTKRDLTVAENYAAHAAVAIENIGRTRRRKLPEPVQNTITSPVKIILWLVVLAMLAWVLFFHEINRYVKAECMVVPRSYSVICRLSGIIDGVTTQEGKTVKKGEPLFSIEKEELELKLSDTDHQLKANEQKVVGFMAGRKLAEALSLKMDIEALKHRRQILVEKIRESTVLSPCDGMVLTPNLDKLRNTRVMLGQEIARVADVSQLNLEIYIDEADWALVSIEQEVVFYLKARPADRGEETKITHVRIMSMDRNQKNVFVVEALLDKDLQRYSPGYEGEARVKVGRTTLGTAILRTIHRKVAYKFF